MHFLCAGISLDKAPSGRVGFGAEVLVGGSDRVRARSSVQSYLIRGLLGVLTVYRLVQHWNHTNEGHIYDILRIPYKTLSLL